MGDEHILVALCSPPLLPFETSLLFFMTFIFRCFSGCPYTSDSWDPGFFELQEIMAVILSLSPVWFYF